MRVLQQLIGICVLLTSFSCASTTGKTKANGQPNIFLFLADDLSYGDLGCTGNSLVNTKNIDQFASESISFDRMYTPSAMCAPSRSALFTGLYPHSNGCHMNHGNIYEHVKSLPVYLKEAGYKVALVGKQHIKPRESFPFDFVPKQRLHEYLQTVDKPLCLIYASSDPHGPHLQGMHNPNMTTLPPKWAGTQNTRKKLAGYYADIAILDSEFRHFLKKIDETGLSENAVTIFTSDHGYDFFAKWSCYEDGLHVPFFLKSTGPQWDATEVNDMTSFVDVLPTFIELSGGDIPGDLDGKSLIKSLNRNSDAGHKYIYGAHTTRGIYSGFNYPIRSITDGKWKYIRNLNHKASFQNIITHGRNFDANDAAPAWIEWQDVLNSKGEKSNWVSFYQNRPYEELYNISSDPDELKNLADVSEHDVVRKTLSDQLDIWMAEQGDQGVESELKVALKAGDMSRVPVK